jgi:hypothetical protein
MSPGGSWNVAGFVDNVFDEIGLRQVDHYGSNEDVDFRRSGANTIPRQFGIAVDYKFGAANKRRRFESRLTRRGCCPFVVEVSIQRIVSGIARRCGRSWDFNAPSIALTLKMCRLARMR